MDVYAFSVSAGDTVLIGLSDDSVFFDPEVRLYDATGTLLTAAFNTSDYLEITRTLTTSATYTLIVADNGGTDIANYRIVLERLDTDAQPITYDQTISGTITPMGDQDEFTFSGAQGQRVTAYLNNVSGWPNYFSLRLASPLGASLAFCNFLSSDCQLDNVTLPATGVYTLTIDGQNDSVGDYALALVRLDGDAQSITYGQTISGTITPMGDQDEFTFSGAQGQRVTAYLNNVSGWPNYFSLRLASPLSASLAFCNFLSSDCQLDNVTLPATGVYTLTIDGQNDSVGDYALTLVRLDGDAQPIAYGQTISGTITPIGDQDEFIFSGTQGQRVTAYLNNVSGWPSYLSLRLASPLSASLAFCNFLSSDCQLDNVTLPATGVYTLTVDGQNDSVGDYALTLNSPDGEVQEIAYDQTVIGLISPIGDQDDFTFTGNIGHRVTAILDNQAWPSSFSLRLGKPDGTSWFCNFTTNDCQIDNVMLPASGVYTLTVDSYGASTGNYALTLNRLDGDAHPITYGQTISNAITPPGDQDHFTFTGAQGQRLTAFLDNQALTSAAFSLGLIKPDGTALTSCAFSYGDCVLDNIPLPVTGTYTLTVDGSGISTGNYALTLTRLEGEQILSIGALQDIFIPSGWPLWYRIDVVTGTMNLFITLQKYTPWSTDFKLYDENSNLLQSASGGGDHMLHLPSPAAGAYYLRVSGSGRGKLAALTALPELLPGQWQVGTILRSWGSVWYQHRVPPGQSSLFINVETIGLWSRLTVYRDTFGSTPYWVATGPTMTLHIPSPQPGIYYVHLTDSALIQGANQARDHLIRADATPLAPPVCSEPMVTSISPTRGGTAGPVTVQINGQCLEAESTVYLTRGGFDNVTATQVISAADRRTLAATFDLSTTVPGDWNLAVTDPYSNSATAPLPFTVESGGEANLWVEILGRAQIRLGRTTTYYIRFGNNGNTNLYDAILLLRFPAGLEYHLHGSGIVDAPYTSTGVEKNGKVLIPIWLLRVRAGEERSIALDLRTNASIPIGTQIEVSAEIYVAPRSLFSATGNPDHIIYSPIYRSIRDAIVAALFPAGYRTEGGIQELEQALQNTVKELLVSAGIGIVATLVTLACLEAGFFGAAIAVAVAAAAYALWGLIDNPFTDLYKAAADLLSSTVVGSISPEDKYGPSGYDAPDTPVGQLKHWIPSSQSLDYRIDFWNKEDAPAATVDVIITDTLDPNLDWSTFKFTEVGFLDWRVPLEPSQYFNVDVSNVVITLSNYYTGQPAVNLVVNVEGSFDPGTGAIRWEFHALDPITREPPENPYAGFLPPITDRGWEIGWVNFSASPKPDLASGTAISNQSFVKFDLGPFKPAPPGGPFVNTLDAASPTSTVQAPAGIQRCNNFLVSWTGQDDVSGSGLQDFDVYADDLDDESPTYLWKAGTAATSAIFTGFPGHQYGFYSRAHDNVGHIEPVQQPFGYDVEITAGAYCVHLPILLRK
jgi:uncharacterized protein YlaN (UPF0358 family)